MVKIYIPKGYSFRGASIKNYGHPISTTEIKIHLKKGRIPIPFPKTTRLKSKFGMTLKSTGKDKKGEYLIFTNRKKRKIYKDLS